MTPIIIVYIIILILELLYIYYYLNNWTAWNSGSLEAEIKYNIENQDEINEILHKEINRRIKLLETMDYDEWLKYNNENIYIQVGPYKQHCFIWERTKLYISNDNYSDQNDSSFIYRCTPFKEYLNLSSKKIYERVNYLYLNGIYKSDQNDLDDMWDLSATTSELDIINNLDVYWLDDFTKTSIRKKMVFKNFAKTLKPGHASDTNPDINEGIIGFGYITQNVELKYAQPYYAHLKFPFFFMINILFLFISLMLYYSIDDNKDITKPILFLFVTNAYLIYYLSSVSALTDLEYEQNKTININAGITAISFLVAVNIFIVQTLRNNKSMKTSFLHNESAFLFCISLMFLLISSFKETNFGTIEQLRKYNIISQFFFNMSIIVNLIIFLNYLLYVISGTKIYRNYLNF